MFVSSLEDSTREDLNNSSLIDDGTWEQEQEQEVCHWDPLDMGVEDEGDQLKGDMQPVVILQKLRQNEELPAQRHECVECLARYSSQKALVEHMWTHARDDPFTCIFCNGQFRFASGLVNHKCSTSARSPSKSPKAPPTQEIDEKPHKCNLCDRAFSELKTLRIHTTAKHGKKQKAARPQCRVCMTEFDTKGQLLVHAADHEPQDGMYRCALCPVQYPSKTSLRSHMRVHTTDKPHQCHKCPQRFSSRTMLWSHLKVHGKNVKYVCSQCQRGFTDRKMLFEHIKVVHRQLQATEPEPPPAPVTLNPLNKPFKCKSCLRTFISINSLKHHKRYSCKGVSNITSEIVGKKHIGKWYKCIRCDERFKTRKKLWWHRLQTHLAQTEPAPPEPSDIEQVATTCDTQTELQTVTKFPCSKCPQVFDDRRSHLCHVRAEHSSESPDLTEPKEPKAYNCGKCSETFYDRKAHFAHYKTYHSSSNPSFSENVDNGCEYTETKPKGFRCSKCPETCADRKSLFSHHKAVHSHSKIGVTEQDAAVDAEPGDRVKISEYQHCSKCTEIFPDHKSYLLHYQTTHGEEPPQAQEEAHEVKGRFHCSKCPEVFSDRKSHFAHYRLVHSYVEQSDEQGKGFRCGKCSQVFYCRSSHMRHYRKVHYEKVPSEALLDSKDHTPIKTEEYAAEEYEECVQVKVDGVKEDCETHDSSSSRQFQCSKCTEIFPDRKSHFAHYKSSHSDFMPEDSKTNSGGGVKIRLKQRQFHCSKCTEVFQSRKEHWLHYQTHSEDIEVVPSAGGNSTVRIKKISKYQHKSVPCPRCTKRFLTQKGLMSHIRWYHKIIPPSASQTVKCCKCPEVFANYKSRREHLETVHNYQSKSKCWHCSKCSQRFTSRFLLVSHIKSHKISSTTYKCEDCEALFDTRGGLRAHAEVHRTGPAHPGLALYDLPPPLFLLPPKARRKSSLTSLPEVKAESTGSDTTTATESDPRPSEPSDPNSNADPPTEESAPAPDLSDSLEALDLSNRVHTVDSKQMPSVQALPNGTEGEATAPPEAEVHDAKRLPGRVARRIGKAIIQRDLSASGKKRKRLHEFSIAKIKAAKLRLQCKKCDASFTSRLGLNSHQRVHVIARPFRCKQCEAAFTNGPNLLQHMKHHLSPKPYKCRQCGECFSNNTSRKKHTAEVHPKPVVEG